MSSFTELTWNKSLTAREYENNFLKFYMQALRKGISSETPTKVSNPESLLTLNFTTRQIQSRKQRAIPMASMVASERKVSESHPFDCYTD